MSIFSLFKQETPEDIYQKLAANIVASALNFREGLSPPYDNSTTTAGAELLYFLVHILDRDAFTVLKVEQRDKLIDEVSIIAIKGYARAVFSSESPYDSVSKISSQMISVLNSRQVIYAKCDSIMGDNFPSKGTMVFALCFYVKKALGFTDRDDVDGILTGEQEIHDTDVKDFPEIESILEIAVGVGDYVQYLQMPRYLKKLKRLLK